MTEPMRWLDPQSDASGDLRALLSAAPHAPPPLPKDAREAGARFVAGLGPAVVIKPWWLRSATLAGGAGTTTVAILVVALSRNAHTPQPQPHRARVAPTVTAPTVTAPAVTPPALTAPTVAPPTVVAPPVVETPPSAPVASPLVERRRRDAPVEERDEARLEEARSALERDPGRTLSIARSLTEHGRRSHFAEEAEYLAVRALARLTRNDEARSEGERFLRRHPSGIYSAAVRRQLENLP